MSAKTSRSPRRKSTPTQWAMGSSPRKSKNLKLKGEADVKTSEGVYKLKILYDPNRTMHRYVLKVVKPEEELGTYPGFAHAKLAMAKAAVHLEQGIDLFDIS